MSAVRNGTFWLGALLGAFIFSHPLCGWTGEEQSERLYVQGLIPFHDGVEAFSKAVETGDGKYRVEGKAKLETALDLFKQAAAEEPAYGLAVYYLGVTYGKLGRHSEAVSPLKKTLQHRPRLVAAQQDLAVAYYHLGRYQEALALLDKAVAAEPGNGLSHYYAGLCNAGLKNFPAATAALERAADTNPQFSPYAYYYSALAHLAEGESKEALEALNTVTSMAEDTELAQRSELLRDRISAQLEGSEADKRWELRLGIGSEYDSNVVLQSDSVPVPQQISNEDDLRFTFSLGGSYDFWRAPTTYLTGDYDFYQNLHLELNDFDIQAHKVRLIGGWNPSPDLNLSLEAGTNYYRVGGDSYLQELYGMPALGFYLKPWTYSQLTYRWADQDYKIFYFDPARDGDRHEIAFRQYFLQDGFDRYLYLGYQYDDEDPDHVNGSDFEYQGNLLEVGARIPVPNESHVDLAYSYHHKDYDNPNSRSIPPFSQKRDDDTHRISLLFSKSINRSLDLYAGYRLTVNNSNIEVFEYDRHIVTAGFQWVY